MFFFFFMGGTESRDYFNTGAWNHHCDVYIRPVGTTTYLLWRIYTSRGIQRVKRATKLHFVDYLRVVMTVFSAAVITQYFLLRYYFIKLCFCSSVLWFFVFLYLWFSDLFWIQCYLKRLNNIYKIREYNPCAL